MENISLRDVVVDELKSNSNESLKNLSLESVTEAVIGGKFPLRKSKLTCIFDFILYILFFASTGVITYFLWTKLHWILAIILMYPIYRVIGYPIILLTAPLYNLLTPENKAWSIFCNALHEGDNHTASKMKEAIERWNNCGDQSYLQEYSKQVKVGQSSSLNDDSTKAIVEVCTNEYDQTILDQTKAIETNPESPGVGRNYFLRGTAYYNKGQYDQAINDYSDAIEHDAMFLGWIAKPGHIGWDDETQRQIQLNPEKEEVFRLNVIKNTHQHQRYPFDYYYRAASHYAKGEYDRAILDYTKTVELEPSMGEAHFQLAKAHLEMGNKDLALEQYKILSVLDGELAEELLNLIN